MPAGYDAEVAELFRDFRAASNLSERDLAAKLATRVEVVQALEQGALAVEDIRMAADILAPVHERTAGADGFVSLEVSPHLAADTDGTVDEARRLWRAVDRPNVMIKVPATRQGIGAIATLIGEGINVNATLMFSLGHYEAVAGAYIEGLGRAADPASVASVASFFVSRIDTAAGRALDGIGTAEAGALKGKIAIANAIIGRVRASPARSSMPSTILPLTRIVRMIAKVPAFITRQMAR